MSELNPETEKIASKNGEPQSTVDSSDEEQHGPLEEIEVDLGEVLKTDGPESYESEHSPFAEGKSTCPTPEGDIDS